MRLTTISVLLVSLLVVSQRLPGDGPLANDDVLDVVPAVASAAIAVRNASELVVRGDAFIRKTGIKVPMRFTDAFRFLLTALQIEKGVNRTGSFVLLAVDAKELESLALAVPLDDIDAMAANFGIPSERFVEGKVVDLTEDSDRPGGSLIRYAAVRKQHLFVGLSERTVRLAVTEKRLRGALPEEAAETLKKDDILVYVRDEIIEELSGGQTGVIDKLVRDIAGPRHAKEMIEASNELKQLTLGIRLDGGVGATFIVDFDGERSRDYLSSLAIGNTNASLSGIPEGKILAAQTFSSRGEAMAVMAQSLFKLTLNGLVAASGDEISLGHRSNLADLFGLGWKSCDETRVVLYENAEPERYGWFSFLAVLETDDADQFVQDMVDLAPYMHASQLTVTDQKEALDEAMIQGLIEDLGHQSFRRRRLAVIKLSMAGVTALPALQEAFDSSDPEIRDRVKSIAEQIKRALAAEREDLLQNDMLRRLRPQLTYLAEQETRLGRPIDFIRMRLRSESEKTVTRMQRLLGPQWNTIRVATVENKVILLVGSDLSYFDTALEIALSDDDDNAKVARFAAFEERASRERSGELHLSLARLDQLVDDTADPTPQNEVATPTTSLDLLISPQRIRMDSFSPFQDVKAVAQKLGW